MQTDVTVLAFSHTVKRILHGTTLLMEVSPFITSAGRDDDVRLCLLLVIPLDVDLLSSLTKEKNENDKRNKFGSVSQIKAILRVTFSPRN